MFAGGVRDHDAIFQDGHDASTCEKLTLRADDTPSSTENDMEVATCHVAATATLAATVPLLSDDSDVQKMMDDLTALLDQCPCTSQKRDRQKKKLNLKWLFSAGRSTNALMLDKKTGKSKGSFDHEHNVASKRGTGVWMGNVEKSSKKKWEKELFKVASELLRVIDPDYMGESGDYSVQFSCMTDPTKHFVKEHVDNKDIAHQYGIVLGNSTGGELVLVLSDGTEQTMDYRRKILKMDGRVPHRVKRFEGTRYSVIFYKLFDRRYPTEWPVLKRAKFV